MRPMQWSRLANVSVYIIYLFIEPHLFVCVDICVLCMRFLAEVTFCSF